METRDEQLFSKEVPLLTAASELCYHTVHCSALNAEELRRECGIEVSNSISMLMKTTVKLNIKKRLFSEFTGSIQSMCIYNERRFKSISSSLSNYFQHN